MKEEWKNIKGYDGLYQVSNKGRIKSFYCNKCIHGNIKNVNRTRILEPFDNGSGYLVVGLTKNKKRKNYYIHRLVADAFIENKDNKEEVNHIDFNKKNNSLENLEWVTSRENSIHAIEKIKKPRFSYKTNTGYHHITYRKDKNIYRVTFNKNNKSYEKTFKDINDAIKYRDLFYGDKKGGDYAWVNQ